MKISPMQVWILLKVQFVSAKGSPCGAEQLEIEEPGKPDLFFELKEMVGTGLLEQFHAPTGKDGEAPRILYRVGPQGAACLLDKACADEARDLTHRVALRMVGVPVQSIRKAQPEAKEINPAKVADEVLNVTEGMD